MATPTYTPIASITLGSSASSVEFSSIPQDYRDLVLVVNWSTSYNQTDGAELFSINFNSDTGNNYSSVNMAVDNNSPLSAARSGDPAGILLIPTSSKKALNTIEIMDYSATDKHKTFLLRASMGDASRFPVHRNAQRYASNSAINSISLDPSTFSISAGSTFALYGIEA